MNKIEDTAEGKQPSYILPRKHLLDGNNTDSLVTPIYLTLITFRFLSISCDGTFE